MTTTTQYETGATTFVKEFTREQFNILEDKLTQYFKYKGIEGKKINSYEDLNIYMGLAYTSSGDYAGTWICNGVIIPATSLHNFIGFTFDEEGDLIGVAWDKEENEATVNITKWLSDFKDMSDLQKSIIRCRIEGDTLYLPSIKEGSLTNYKDVKAALENAGATYERSKFIFPNDAQPYIDRLMGGESVNIKKEFQFFATPAKLAKRLVELANINSPDLEVLEPSAGQGAIVKAILEHEPGVCVHAYELMDVNRNVLSTIKDCILLGEDFLKSDMLCDTKEITPINWNLKHRDLLFDRIIANPPFNKNQDIDHITEMYHRLRKGGRIVTIASNSWRTGSQKKQIAFREWLNKVNAVIEDIPAGEFKESGTNIATCLIIIDK